MGKRRSEQDRGLQAVWEQIPEVQCKGLCAQSCGPIDASAREKQRLRQRGIRLLPREQALLELRQTGTYRCPALDHEDRCSVYAERPTVCRLWGAQQSMRCPYECEVDGGLLDDVTGLQLLVQSLHAGGDSGQLGAAPLLSPAAVDEVLRQPAARAAVDRLLRPPAP